MHKYKSFFFCCGLIMAVSEIWKQYCLTFLIGQGTYNWWYFPFQLCSIPMYLCLLLPWIRSERLRRIFLAFLMDYGLLGGIFAFFDTSGMHYSYLPLTIHSFAWHILLIVLGIAAGLSQYADYSCHGYLGSACCYLFCCLLATLLNVSFHTLGTINMFYISPFLPMTQRFFKDIAKNLENPAGILLYILASMLGAGIFHLIWHQVSSHCTGTRSQEP